MSNFLIIHVTYPNEEIATAICSRLLKERLIACANIYPVQSMYNWEGKTVHEKEWISELKSMPKNMQAVQLMIEELHPYEIPCITRSQGNANVAYSNWVAKECE